jgi:surface carbohydrate biosynthesis protein
MRHFPIIYLPVELGAREFEGKALLAAVLAKRGYSVLLGQQWTIGTNFDILPPGAVLLKSFNVIHRPAMLAAKQYNFRTFLLEEELLSHTEKKAIAGFCTDGVFDIPDMILANGAHEKEVLIELGGRKDRIEVTGNPRADILKPAYHRFYKREIDAVRAHFGAFVLVNTNFGIVNSIYRDLHEVTRVHVEAGFIRPDDPASISSWDDQVEFERLNKAAMIAAIKDLCGRRPDLNVVVRPHPAESLEHWAGVFDSCPKVSIVREGPHVPWTLGCELLLHTSCTTGFEAYVAGKTALSLVVKPNWISQSFIANRLNPLFTDEVKLIDAAVAYLDRGEITASAILTPAEAERYVWNIGQKNAAHRIASLLTADLPSPRRAVPLPKLRMYERTEAQKQKFNMSGEACRDTLGRILDIIGKGRPFGADQVGDSLFYLSPTA